MYLLFLQLRKRNPSPTPSAMSSTSSASHNSANNRDKRAPQQSSSQHLLAAATGHSKFGKYWQTPAVLTIAANIIRNSSCFSDSGAASPHAVKKLLSLSEQSKTRPKSALGHHSHSPATPLSGRKGGSSSLVGAGSSSGNNGGGQQHSPSSAQGPNGDVCAVDLTAESSSVTSLPVMRKVHNTGTLIAEN